MATVASITSKPYGYLVTNLSCATVTLSQVRLNKVIYVLTAGETSGAVALSDAKGDVFWRYPKDQTNAGSVVEDFCDFVVNGIKIVECPNASTSHSLVLHIP